MRQARLHLNRQPRHDAGPRRTSELQTLTPDQVKARLFIGCFPSGLVYCDMAITEFGDFKRVAFLPYRTLVLDIDAPNSPLLDAVREHAAGMEKRRGQEFVVSTCGQTVMLGDPPPDPDMTQPYQVRTGCGHIVTRRMRPSTAGVPFTPDTVIEAPNGRPCEQCEVSSC